MNRPLRTVLCGTGFGRFHREGIRLLPDDLELVGVLARGREFSRAYAAAEGVPLHTRVEDLPGDVDLACVAIGSAVSGGPGAEIARALLDRGVHVLQEHPVHREELAGLLRAARAAGVVYRLNPFYRHVPAVRRFLDGARRMRALGPILSVDATSAVQVLYPLLDVLSSALGGTAPWALGDPLPADARVEAAGASPQPYRVLQGALAGVPLTLRVQHQLDPSDGDNHALIWHRIAITGEGGTLTLADAHGPVLWQPRLHAPRDEHGRLRSTGPGTAPLAEPALDVVPGTEPPSWRGIFSEIWPLTMAHALRETVEDIRSGTDPLPRGQRDLSVAAVWHDLLDRLGRPEVIRPAAPASWPLHRVLPPTEESAR